MAEAFTWFSKLTDVLEQVPDEGMRQRLAYAIVMYGSMDVEPELEWPLNALFEAVREDLDNSRAARVRGRKGGRPRKATKNEAATNDAGDARSGPFEHGTADDSDFNAQKAAPTDPEMVPETASESGTEGLETRLQIGFGLAETTGLQTQKPDVQTGFENLKTTGFATGETQTKPIQANPSQSKPDQTRRGGRAGAPTPPSKKPKRFKPPTEAEVEAYGRESGYVVNPIAFCGFHASRGWTVSGQPMKDWRAAVRSWWTKDHPDSAPPSPPGAAPKKRSAADELAELNELLGGDGR